MVEIVARPGDPVSGAVVGERLAPGERGLLFTYHANYIARYAKSFAATAAAVAAVQVAG
jgi:hypothetical protein